jgi:hypothetical protein
MKNLFVGVLTWKLLTEHFSTHPYFSLHNRINISEDWWVLTTPHNPISVCYNVIYCLGICRTTPRNQEWVRDTKFVI